MNDSEVNKKVPFTFFKLMKLLYVRYNTIRPYLRFGRTCVGYAFERVCVACVCVLAFVCVQ